METEKKPKILPSSLRSKKRYIVFEVISEKPIQYGELVGALWSSSISFLGELGTGKNELWIIQNLYDIKKQKGVIKCRNDAIELVRVCLMLIRIIGETNAIIKILGVTGTIDSAEKKYFSIKSLKEF